MQFSITTALVSFLAASATAAPVEQRAASGKKGVAYNVASLANAFKGTASWGYNWGSSSGGLDSSIKYIPMQHGPKDSTAGALGAAKSAGYLLGYNEPDMTVAGGGCATTPSDAAPQWKALVQSASGFQIGSPAVTSNNGTSGPVGPSGLVWMREFLGAVGGAKASKIDFVNLHWYGVQGQSGKAQANLLQDYLKRASADINSMFGRSMPIWVTEFAALPVTDATVQAEFLNAMVPFLDGYAPVARYSPFMVAEGQLTSSSASGQAFIKAN